MSLLPDFTRILAHRPARTLADGLTTRGHLGTPDIDLCLAQYDAYIDALKSCGLAVTVMPADTAFPDGHYVEDTAVIFRDLAFLTRPGAAARQHEPKAIAEKLTDLNIVWMNGDDGARLEGGDVLFTEDRVLVGLSERTNAAGAAQLASALRDVQADIRVETVPLTGVLHLKTGLTELAPGKLLHDPHMQTDFAFDFAEVVTLPAEEGYAANVMPINDCLIMSAGFPTVRAEAEKHFDTIIELDMSEFEKMDGSLTCLSLRY